MVTPSGGNSSSCSASVDSASIGISKPSGPDSTVVVISDVTMSFKGHILLAPTSRG